MEPSELDTNSIQLVCSHDKWRRYWVCPGIGERLCRNADRAGHASQEKRPREKSNPSPLERAEWEKSNFPCFSHLMLSFVMKVEAYFIKRVVNLGAFYVFKGKSLKEN